MSKMKRVIKMVVLLLVFTLVVPIMIPVFSGTSVARAATGKLSDTKLTLSIGDTHQLSVKGATGTVKWSSGNKSVATVTSEGKVTAKKTGTTKITATANSKKYTCKVTVKKAELTTVYGKVTAISGKEITLALGTLNGPGQAPSDNKSNTAPSGTPPAAPGGSSSATQGGTPPAAPSGSSSTTQGGTQGTIPTGGAGSSSNAAPTGSGSGTAPDMLTLTGKSITITISDTAILSKESMQVPGGQTKGSSDTSSNTTTSGTSTAALSDIAVGSILKVTYNSSIDNLTAVVIMGAGQTMASQGGSQPGGSIGGGQGSSTASTGTGAYNLTDGEALAGGTYTSTNADENAIRSENSVKASLTDVTVKKTGGAASSSDASSFYGLNSAILALGNSTLNIIGGSVTATTEGSNGVFAYDGATINITDTTIDVSGGNAGGIEVAGGGKLTATNLTVNAKVKAAIRSDRGGGTLTVNGGTYTTSGSSGAPAIYSTANITANNAVLTANDSEAVVVEGLNSVTLNNCIVTGNMSGTYGSGSSENIHNVMLYQSMSGDAQIGNSSFTMTGGTLTSKSGDMFYVTNTESIISLSNIDLSLASGTKLLLVAGNDGSRGWGSAGSNGGTCTFTASKQILTGDITVDKISKLTMSIKNSSTFTGAINSDGTAASSLSVTVDSSSTWTLTADSYVTEFNGSMSNVNTNGHTLYVNGVAKN